MAIQILLADDHQLVRKGLKTLLEGEPGFKVAAEAENGMEAVRLAKKLLPDVVVMDLTMPKLNGIEAIRSILEVNNKISIVALSMHSEPRYVSGALQAGARGYLLKDSAPEDLISAVKAVKAGRAYIGPEIADIVIQGFTGRLPAGSNKTPAHELTPREREIVQLIAEGHNKMKIADLLKISIKTVESHTKNIKEKLGLENQIDLAKYAIREGLISIDFFLQSPRHQ
jgi:DNA-binding NarL/FixJ family response regulator